MPYPRKTLKIKCPTNINDFTVCDMYTVYVILGMYFEVVKFTSIIT